MALCLQYNVAEGNGADTTGNLPVSEEAVRVAEVVGCRQWSVLVELLSLGTMPFPFPSLSLLEGRRWPGPLAPHSQAWVLKQQGEGCAEELPGSLLCRRSEAAQQATRQLLWGLGPLTREGVGK